MFPETLSGTVLVKLRASRKYSNYFLFFYLEKVESEPNNFFKYAKAGVAFLDVLELVSDLYFCLATPTPTFGQLLEVIVLFIFLNDSKN